MSSDTTDVWSTMQLDHIAELSLGKMLDKEKNKGELRPYLANINVQWGSFDLHDLREMRFEERELERYGLRSGDIVMCEGGEPGRCALWMDDEPGMMIQKALHRIRPKHGIDNHYLYYALSHNMRSGACDEYMTGSGIKHLPGNQLAKIEVSIPPLYEQRRIAEVLRSVDDAIAASRASLDQVNRARAAILHAAFEETPWEAVSLGELGTWQSGGTPSKDDAAKWGGDVPWVCPRDMKAPVIRQTHSTLTPLALNGSCKLVPKGTLMVVVRGMILAKAIPTAMTAMDAAFNQDMKAFRPNGRALPKFVQLCLQHQERQLLRVVNTATHGTKKLDTDTLLSVSVPLPDLEAQQALTGAVSDLDFASVKYGEEHLRLGAIKQALASDLLCGRVQVPA